MHSFRSIDQNSNTLWDTAPKLMTLARQGLRGTHYLEDIDMPFTRRGAQPGDEMLEIVPERYYRGGVSDWGAALFYSDFLGRQPLDITVLEEFTGWTTAALSRRLGGTVDELYDRWSPSDNYQLVGASYARDLAYHRVIGDLRVDEVAPHLKEIMVHSQADLLARFPENEAQSRIDDWFGRENALLQRLLGQLGGASLCEFYRHWLGSHLPGGVDLKLTSELFALNEESGASLLASDFIRNYDEFSRLYNRAISETNAGLNPLNRKQGELPFFVVLRRDGQMVRCGASLQDGFLVANEYRWALGKGGGLPVGRMREDNVVCFAGKALLLVLQVRLNPSGVPLALPHLGSLYMPSAYAFERCLKEAGRLPSERPHPVLRVRFNFLDQWEGLRTLVRVPDYLQGVFSRDELSAGELAAEIRVQTEAAKALLDDFRGETGRKAWAEKLFPAVTAERAALETQRREIAKDPDLREQSRTLWNRIKELDCQLLEEQAEAAVRALRIVDLNYYDSRGALVPWSIALGGPSFLDTVLDNAKIHQEEAYEH